MTVSSDWTIAIAPRTATHIAVPSEGAPQFGGTALATRGEQLSVPFEFTVVSTQGVPVPLTAATAAENYCKVCLMCVCVCVCVCVCLFVSLL